MLWVGDPRPEKRLDLVHAAFALLAQRRPDVELKIVSRVPHADIPTYMSAAHVFILPSDHEGSPVVIKEAMACNLPIVAVDVGDVAQVIGGVAGCYLAERNAEDLADKLEQALAGGAASAGRAAIQHLQTSAEAQAILDMYNELV